MKPGVIFYGSLLLSWFEYLWDSYLDSRQRKVLRKNVTAPKELSGIVTEETFTKARLYSLDKSNFGLVQGVFKQILDTVVMWFLGYKLCWDAAGNPSP
jgi:STE24 endopeptidase